MDWFRIAAAAALTAAMGLSSCSDDVDPDPSPESRGELGFATFQYECVSVADPQCDREIFPRFVATGGDFDANFTLSNRLPDSVSGRGVESAAQGIISDELGVLRGERPGVVALLALGNDDTVIDYINVFVLDVDRIAIRATENQPACTAETCDEITDEDGTFVLVPGRDVRVEALPFGYGELLAGALDYDWEALDPAIVDVDIDFDGRAVLSAYEVGEARITVTTQGVTETIVLHVLEGPPDPPDPPSTDTGAESTGGDTGTDTGSGSGSGSGGSDSATSTGSGSDSGGSDSGSSTGGM